MELLTGPSMAARAACSRAVCTSSCAAASWLCRRATYMCNQISISIAWKSVPQCTVDIQRTHIHTDTSATIALPGGSLPCRVGQTEACLGGGCSARSSGHLGSEGVCARGLLLLGGLELGHLCLQEQLALLQLLPLGCLPPQRFHLHCHHTGITAGINMTQGTSSSHKRTELWRTRQSPCSFNSGSMPNPSATYQ